MYAAMMIDLKKSRAYGLQERAAIQAYIIRACELLNHVFGVSIVRGVEFSAGDEIQGLFSDATTAYLYYRLFSMLVHPVKIRAGIGCGTWDIQIDNQGTTAQDGQAYHHARTAIQAAAEQEVYAVLLYSGRPTDATINALLGAEGALLRARTAYQNELLLLTELYYPISRESGADHRALFAAVRLLREKPALPFWHSAKESIFADWPDDMGAAVEPVDIAPEEASFYITSGKTRGIPTKLSSLLQISRQSVDATLKNANIYTARNLTISALRLMTEIT